jgi:hypothetical protein
MLDTGNRKWKDLVTGKIPLQTDNLGLQMMLKRSATRLTAQSSAADIEKAIAEVHSFFVKYERILQKEIAILSK